MAHLPAALSVALIAAGPALAASFDCGKPGLDPAAKLVCADAEVSTLDEHLSRYYDAARAAVGPAAGCVRDDQRTWLATVRARCRDAACLRRAYRERLAELDALQPGATAVKGIELPRTRALEWVVGPAADTAAAPRRGDVRPLLATGAILDEVERGEGFVLRTADGARYVLVLLMFLEPATAGRLQQMARSGATYTARGFRVADERHYEPSRCLFLYREP